MYSISSTVFNTYTGHWDGVWKHILKFQGFVEPTKYIFFPFLFVKCQMKGYLLDSFEFVLIVHKIRATKRNCKHNLKEFGTKWNAKDGHLLKWLL